MRCGQKGEAALPVGGRGVRLREPTRLAHIIEGFPPLSRMDTAGSRSCWPTPPDWGAGESVPDGPRDKPSPAPALTEGDGPPSTLVLKPAVARPAGCVPKDLQEPVATDHLVEGV